MMRTVLLWLCLLLPSVHANAGVAFNGNCYTDINALINGFKQQYPLVDQGKVYFIGTITVLGPSSFSYQHGIQDMITGAVTVSPVIGYGASACTANPVSTSPASVVGADSNNCLATSTCTNSDVVSAQIVTHDVLIYACAVLLFFFGFHVGNGVMMGSLRRQG